MRGSALALALVIGCGHTQIKEDVPPEPATGTRQVAAVRGTSQMVGAANPHASRAGWEILEQGGSAVDAAIAMSVILTLVEPQSSGIGGGGFMLHWNAANQHLGAYDGRETAPAAVTPNLFMGPDNKPQGYLKALVGGKSVGVPGQLRMLGLAHHKHGKLPWERLFAPAIRLADSGFRVSPRLFDLLTRLGRLMTLPNVRRYFFLTDGAPKPVGHLIKNAPLARALRTIAAQGADAFYIGPLAEDIVRTVNTAPRNPGAMTLADLAGYKARERKAICVPFQKSRVCGFPPPTSGGTTVLTILGLLDRLELGATFDSIATTHAFLEASRLAYADRALYIADPDFSPPPGGLLSPEYLDRRARLIDPKRSMGKASAGQPSGFQVLAPDQSPELPSTSHLVAVDSAGNWVSMTQSIEFAFGSQLMVHGFLLNNELTDFSFTAQADGKPVANRIEPGKRPRSSMAPMIALDADGRPILAMGSPGGSRIIEYVARVIVSVLRYSHDPQTAIAQPNISNRNGVSELEKAVGFEAWAARTSAALKGLGHEVSVVELNSGIQAIAREAKGLIGGADPRREGLILAR